MADTEMTETEDYDKSADPTDHASNHESGGSDEISVAGLSGKQICVPFNAKIADISESDIDKHFLDLQTAFNETRKITAAIIAPARQSGTGYFSIYSNEGILSSIYSLSSAGSPLTIIKDGTQRIQYRQTVANDDFDVYCFGYLLET